MTTTAAGAGSFVFPASFAQQRLWFLADSDPTGVAYNVAKAVLLRGALDVAALRQALALVVERHEILRTRFDRVDDRLVQVLSDEAGVEFAIEDAAAPAEAGIADTVRRPVRDEARRPFDLRRGPLVRARLYRLGGDRFLFCLTLHHIVCDAWSLGLIYREVIRAYSAFAHGQAPSLPGVTLQYADFAVWEQEHEHGPRQAEALEFWRTELAGLPASLNWPADFPRPAAPTWQGEQVTAALPDAAARAVRELAQQERTTPAVVLLAGFAAFLHRWTGDTDIPIGMPLAGRDRIELESVVGCFVNTAIARFRLKGGPLSFRDVVRTGRTLMLAALRHQSASFDAVVQAVRPSTAARGLSPLFHALFTVHSVSEEREQLGSLECTAIPAPTGTAKSDVTFVAVESRDRVRVSVEFNRDLFDSRTMAAAVEAFRTLIAAALECPDTNIGDLPLAPAGQELALAGPARPYPRDTGVHTLFAQIAANRGKAVAIDIDGEPVTYAGLQHRAAAVTAALQDAGVTPGQFVGLLMDRGAALVAGMIGVLGAGAAYVPVDPSDPPARLATILEDAGVQIVLTTAGAAVPAGVRALDIDSLLRSPSAQAASPVETRGDTPAYMIYTSGSTGAPKGVVVPHRAIARLVLETDYVQVGPADRVALASNVAFDAATFEIWGALLNGAAVVPLPTSVVTSPALLGREIQHRRLSVMFVTTAVFNRVAADEPGAFRPLRALLFGGEASSPRAVASVIAAGPPAALLHVYGPTECTTFATAHLVTSLEPRAATVPIGLPIANTTARLMDERGAPVAPGATGELWLGGDGVALGYHGRHEQTEERFVRHDGVRMYRTGDRCRVNAAGLLEFVSRMDRQLKIRGFRIEPAEVERALASHEAVAGAVVDAIGEGDGHRLVACVTARKGQTLDAGVLLRYLGERLPRFAIPAISIVPELPLTDNGKIDRRRLGAALAADAATVGTAADGRPFAAPRDPLEEELVRIWESLLEVSPIGITDDFFLLGGHSLLAAAMMDRVEKQFGRRVPVSALLQYPTIEGLASRLWEAERTASGPLVALRESGTRTPLFFLHGDLNGAGLYCARLARLLNSDQPLYSLAPLGLDGGPAPPSIEAMAEVYAGLIRKCRPAGPIALGGYCHGALLAFEIARRLERERQVVHLLMVYPPAVEPRLAPFDSAIRAVCRVLGRDEASRVSLTLRVGDAVRVLAASRGRGLAGFVAAKVARVFRPRTPAPRRSPDAGTAASARPTAAVERHDPRTWARYVRAVAAYVPRRYHGSVRLLIPEDRTESSTRGWHRAAPQAVAVDIAGDHRGCITTHLDSLARTLDRELAGAPQDAADRAAVRRCS